MIRAPAIMMVGAVMASAFGLVLVALSGREPVLFWYGVPVTLLGLLLAGMWVRDRSRPLPPLPATPEETAAMLPGKWYPVALLVIWAALVAWVIFWTRPPR